MTPVIKTALSLLLALSPVACTPLNQPDNPDQPGSNGAATPSVEPAPAIPRVQIQVLIQDRQNQVVSGAQVTISSSNEASQSASTGTDGKVSFQNLRQDTVYQIAVRATGYEHASRQADLSQLSTLGQNELVLGVVVNAISTSVSGQVLDSHGQPLEGAVVFDTRQTRLTDAEGYFVLPYQQAGSLRLAISKAGYEQHTRTLAIEMGQAQNLGQITLNPQSRQLVVGLDLSHAPLGRSGDQALQDYQGLRQVLQDQGYEVRNVNRLLEQLNDLDTLLLISPSQSFQVEEISAIQAFVISGRKVLITGEWAGFHGFSASSANQVLAPFQLGFGLDTLREGQSGYLNINKFEPHPATQGLNQLKLYQSGSVLVNQGNNPGQILARSASNSFRIQSNTGAFGVVAATAFGSGKAVAVGDSSLWSDADSDGNGVANLHEADNRRLLEQLLAW